jgi:prepilin-type N-terminal cleavage/methylation domain-containing protein
MKRFSNQQRGDTIVEVLISMAVISLILAAGYAITNRNVATTQDSQERSQAQQLVKQQAEQLRVLSANGGITLNNTDCTILNGTNVQVQTSAGGACDFLASGSPCGTSTAACYQVRINKSIVNGVTTYLITATWTNSRAKQSTVELDYGV